MSAQVAVLNLEQLSRADLRALVYTLWCKAAGIDFEYDTPRTEIRKAARSVWELHQAEESLGTVPQHVGVPSEGDEQQPPGRLDYPRQHESVVCDKIRSVLAEVLATPPSMPPSDSSAPRPRIDVTRIHNMIELVGEKIYIPLHRRPTTLRRRLRRVHPYHSSKDHSSTHSIDSTPHQVLQRQNLSLQDSV